MSPNNINPLPDDGNKENEDKNQNPNSLEATELEKDEDFAELDEETLKILGEGLSKNEEEFIFHPKLAPKALTKRAKLNSSICIHERAIARSTRLS